MIFWPMGDAGDWLPAFIGWIGGAVEEPAAAAFTGKRKMRCTACDVSEVVEFGEPCWFCGSADALVMSF